MNTGINTRIGGEKFNTQELLRTGFDLPLKGNNSVKVKGSGSELRNRKRVLGKANRKMISTKKILRMIDVAKSKKEKDIEREFWEVFQLEPQYEAKFKSLLSTKDEIMNIANNEVESRFKQAIDKLKEKDSWLLNQDVSERSISNKNNLCVIELKKSSNRKHIGRPEGTRMDKEHIIRKYQRLAADLKNGMSLTSAMKVYELSKGTIIKVKKTALK